MKHDVVRLVGKSLSRFDGFRTANPGLFPAQTTLYPVLFFGDIRRAAALTLALNPARTEFARNRHWLPGLDAYALTTRLLHYFDLPVPEPHRWFGDLMTDLAAVDCDYGTNTAHIDLCPLPTYFRKEMAQDQQILFGELIEKHSESHLARLLKLAGNTKLILIRDYTFTRSDGSTSKLSEFIRTRPSLLRLLKANGRRLMIWQPGGFVDF